MQELPMLRGEMCTYCGKWFDMETMTMNNVNY